ncbi:MAG: hypothetical protein RLY78_196 [Pseudomonadota bacterium]
MRTGECRPPSRPRQPTGAGRCSRPAPRRLQRLHGLQHPRRGLTWPLLLFLLALTAAGLGSAAPAWWAQAQAEREREWSWRAEQYVRALDDWARASPDGQPRRPQSLEQLLRDERQAPVRHHLRRLYPDPWTGRTDWLPVRAADGGIVGLRSRSPRLRPTDGTPDSPSARPYTGPAARRAEAGATARAVGTAPPPPDPRRADAWWFAATPTSAPTAVARDRHGGRAAGPAPVTSATPATAPTEFPGATAPPDRPDPSATVP